MPPDLHRDPIADAPISLVLPASNCAAAVGAVLAEWKKVLDGLKREYEVLVVDDGSGDGTPGAVEEFGARMPQLRLLRHDQPQGYGRALKTGIAEAKYPLLCCCPCTGEYTAADLPGLLARIDAVDLVSGTRCWQRPPKWLRLPAWFFGLFVLVLLGFFPQPPRCWLGGRGFWWRRLNRWVFAVRLPDLECAFRLFRRELAAKIPIQSRGTFADIEVAAKANFFGALMDAEPVGYRPDAAPKWPAATWEDFRKVVHRPKFVREARPPEELPPGGQRPGGPDLPAPDPQPVA